MPRPGLGLESRAKPPSSRAAEGPVGTCSGGVFHPCRNIVFLLPPAGPLPPGRSPRYEEGMLLEPWGAKKM